jgi:glutathione synthase
MDDIRSNLHAGGKRKQANIGKKQLEIAETIRPKLIADGMFLVGVDIVGDKVLEVNVFSPGNLEGCSELAGVNFSETVLEGIERKVKIAEHYEGRFDNRHIAVM